MLKFILKCCVVFFLVSQFVVAEPITLQANLANGSKTMPFPRNFTDGGRVKIEIINKLPNHLYNSIFEVNKIKKMNTKEEALGSFTDAWRRAECAEIELEHKEIQEKLFKTKNESEIPIILSKIRRLYTDECPVLNGARYEDYEKATVEEMGPFDVYKDEDILLTYHRKDKNETKEWKFEWKARQKDHWLIHFGFSFIKKNQDLYYLKENKKEDKKEEMKYTITKQRSSKGYDYLPSLMYTYYNDDWLNISSFQSAVTVGLNFKNDLISIFLGPSMILAKNLLLTAGINVGKVSELKGKYSENQIVRTNIDKDDLYEDVYKARFHFTIAYTFDGHGTSEHNNTLSLVNSSIIR